MACDALDPLLVAVGYRAGAALVLLLDDLPYHLVIVLVHLIEDYEQHGYQRADGGDPADEQAYAEYRLGALVDEIGLLRVVAEGAEDESEEAGDEAVYRLVDEGAEGGDDALTAAAGYQLVNVGHVGLDIGDNEAGAREAEVIEHRRKINEYRRGGGRDEAVYQQTRYHERAEEKAAHALVDIANEQIVYGRAGEFGDARNDIQHVEAVVSVRYAPDIELIGV